MKEPELHIQTMKQLPVDDILDKLKNELRINDSVVLQAPPGAGKTTRVPISLLNESWLGKNRILMLQPRRIAARHAAEFMASELGEAVGQTVGYSIRFERKHSNKTRIEVVTEGILTRRLQADPELTDVGLIIFDEFHERSIHSDLALALCREVQAVLRDDLKILVMSATLDAEPVAALLDNCPVLTSSGRCHEVTIQYLPSPPATRIADNVTAGIKSALQNRTGDILAFLPGVREIHECADNLRQIPNVDVRLLYGALPFKKQREALYPGIRRRIVLATNIAETSLTIEGIATVVDSGWERRARYDSGTGITRLELKRISAASATQRSGRAGRTGAGQCYRLWSEGQHAELLPQTPPEIRTCDLTPLLLELANWGEANPARLSWLDPPSPALISAGQELLYKMGAITAEKRITSLGQLMVRLPLPPRQARLLVAAQEDDFTSLGCELAALLSERDIFDNKISTTVSDCDLKNRWLYLRANYNSSALSSLQRIINDLKAGTESASEATWPKGRERFQRWLALAYPDRIARQREPGSRRYLLSDGSGATLSMRSALTPPACLVALDMVGGSGEKEISLASSIDTELIFNTFKNHLTTNRMVHWDQETGRLRAHEAVSFGALKLKETPIKADKEQRITAILNEIRRIGLEQMAWSVEARQLQSRVCLCRQHHPDLGLPDFSLSALSENLHQWLSPFINDITTQSALMQFDFQPALQSSLNWEQQQILERLTPERISVPSGSRIRIDYTAGETPLLSVKLQELFGLGKTPKVLCGTVPVVIQMLSPAGRPLAVTQDLEFFWNQVYPEVRKEMRGRYPKHPWPEDPWHATASAKTKKQLSRL